MTLARPFILSVVLLATTSAPLFAQTPQLPPPPAQPQEPPPGWTGSFGAGLAATQGNSDTSTVNVAYEVKRDTGSNVLFKSIGLFIRGESEGDLTTNRLALDGRVDRKLNQRLSLFGALQYLQDEFKEIDYLVAPTIGVSNFFVKTDRTELAVDTGVGVVWEKNLDREVKSAGALTAGQNFKRKLGAASEFNQRATALWKMNDFDDGLYIFGIGLAASVTSQTQIKVEALDTFKNKPPDIDVKKNDVAVLVSFVYKY